MPGAAVRVGRVVLVPGAGARPVGVEGRLLVGVLPVLFAGGRPVGVPGRLVAVLGRLLAGLLAGLRATGVSGGVRMTYTSARSHSQYT